MRLLELRIRQELIGLSPAWVRELATLLTGSDDAVRDETARLFVSIAAQEKLDPRVKFEIDSTLSRIRTMSQLPEGLLARLDRYEEEERQKLSRKEAAQLVERAGHARDRGDWREGWQLLDRAVQIDASLAEVRSAYVCDWAAELAGQLRRDLTQDRIAFAEGTRRVLATLPRDHFSPELLAQLDELEEDYQEAWSRHGIKVSMDRANSMLNSDQNEEALAILDEVQGRVSEGRRVQFDVLYAKTLAACGRIDEAIEILDRLDRVGALVRYRDTVVFRDYGILLSLAGRSEEAQKILEELPLNLFDSQAFHALVVALEKQGEWESVIARLQGLSTMPDKYRPIWVHCAAQAAKRRLRSGDAAAAKLLLESYLDKKDYENPEVKEVYVQVLVETDQLDEACEIILTADEDLLSFMPTKLMNMVRDRAVNELSDEQRFDLYVRLLQHAQDPELTETVDELWPRFGSYFPTPGDYAIKYQVRTLNPSGSTRDIETIDLELAWTEGHFDVKTPTGPETWRIEDGVWYRSTAGVEMRIPCRASAKPPYPVEQFRDAGQLWSAQIVEAGVPVEVKGRSFENCLKIHVINEGNQNSFRFVYLAPKIGVVLREEHRFGEITKVWEFSEIQLR